VKWRSSDGDYRVEMRLRRQIGGFGATEEGMKGDERRKSDDDGILSWIKDKWKDYTLNDDDVLDRILEHLKFSVNNDPKQILELGKIIQRRRSKRVDGSQLKEEERDGLEDGRELPVGVKTCYCATFTFPAEKIVNKSGVDVGDGGESGKK